MGWCEASGGNKVAIGDKLGEGCGGGEEEAGRGEAAWRAQRRWFWRGTIAAAHAGLRAPDGRIGDRSRYMFGLTYGTVMEISEPSSKLNQGV